MVGTTSIGWLVIVLAIAGAGWLANNLTLEPSQIEARAQQMRGGLADYWQRRKTKRQIFALIAIGMVVYFVPAVPRIVLLAFGVYALLVVLRLVFRPTHPPVRGGLNLPPAIPNNQPPDAGAHVQPQPEFVAAMSPPPAPAAPPPVARQPVQPPQYAAPHRPMTPPRPPAFDYHTSASAGSVFATVAVLGVVIALGMGMLFTYSEFRAEALSVTGDDGMAVRRIPELPGRLRRAPQVTINNKIVRVGPHGESASTTVNSTRKKEDLPISVPKDPNLINWNQVLGKRIEIVSDEHDDPKVCESDVMQSVVDLLPMALQHTNSDVGDEVCQWKPTKESLEDILSGFSSAEVSPDPAKGGATKRAKIILDLSQDKLSKLYDRFVTDRSSERSYRLARAYAGAVLLLGGVSILMRIGSGRKPK